MSKSTGVKEMSLMDTADAESSAQTLAVRESGLKPAESNGMLPMIERLAAMPDFDVAKLEKLIDMQERILNRDAEAAFNSAFAEMQAQIPEIDERGRIVVEGSLRSRYAKNEDIQKVLKPILKQHGFSLGFKTEWPEANKVKVIGILTHTEGHARRSEFLAAADKTGSKNDVQALGSSISYGRRYTTCDLLNITTRGQDDDAEASGKPEPPAGYDAFWAVLEGLAPNGIQELTAAFNRGSVEFRNYTVGPNKHAWALLKNQAQQAGAGRKR